MPVVIDPGGSDAAIQIMERKTQVGIAIEEIDLGGKTRGGIALKAPGEFAESGQMVVTGIKPLPGRRRDHGEEFPGGRQQLAAVAPGELELALPVEARQGTTVVQRLGAEGAGASETAQLCRDVVVGGKGRGRHKGEH